jgi:hypothetical protein
MAGHSPSKNGVLLHAYVPAIHVLTKDYNSKDVDAARNSGVPELRLFLCRA